MIGRLQDLFRRRGQPSAHQPRPNELRLDVVRAERLRRESRLTAAATRAAARSSEELGERRVPPAPTLPVNHVAEPWLITALKSRSGLRQAWVLREVLGPPMALHDPRRDGPGIG